MASSTSKTIPDRGFPEDPGVGVNIFFKKNRLQRQKGYRLWVQDWRERYFQCLKDTCEEPEEIPKMKRRLGLV